MLAGWICFIEWWRILFKLTSLDYLIDPTNNKGPKWVEGDMHWLFKDYRLHYLLIYERWLVYVVETKWSGSVMDSRIVRLEISLYVDWAWHWNEILSIPQQSYKTFGHKIISFWDKCYQNSWYIRQWCHNSLTWYL